MEQEIAAATYPHVPTLSKKQKVRMLKYVYAAKGSR